MEVKRIKFVLLTVTFHVYLRKNSLQMDLFSDVHTNIDLLTKSRPKPKLLKNLERSSKPTQKYRME